MPATKPLSVVVISGREYTIRDAPMHEIDPGGDAVGHVDPLTQEILVYVNAQPLRRFEVVLHEIIHVLSDDLCLGMEEDAVHALGVALADTLTRNGIVKL